jgi:hypothetical protein
MMVMRMMKVVMMMITSAAVVIIITIIIVHGRQELPGVSRLLGRRRACFLLRGLAGLDLLLRRRRRLLLRRRRRRLRGGDAGLQQAVRAGDDHV